MISVIIINNEVDATDLGFLTNKILWVIDNPTTRSLLLGLKADISFFRPQDLNRLVDTIEEHNPDLNEIIYIGGGDSWKLILDNGYKLIEGVNNFWCFEKLG